MKVKGGGWAINVTPTSGFVLRSHPAHVSSSSNIVNCEPHLDDQAGEHIHVLLFTTLNLFCVLI